MASLISSKLTAKKVDERKQRLEASVSPKIRAVFRHMANDVENLYKTTGSLPAQELSNNYYPEFLAEIRNAMRRSIKEFGFDLRINLEEKHMFMFYAEHKRALIDYDLKATTSISDTNLTEKVNQINSQFFRASTFFVANQSELQNQYVTQTNLDEMLNAKEQEEVAFADSIAQRQRDIDTLTRQEALAVGVERARLRKQIESALRQLAESNANKNEIIAKNIKINLLNKSTFRSDLIASQNIGIAESWARQTEAQLINDADLTTSAGEKVNIVKEWVAILDSKTRAAHVSADGQIVPVDEPFIVDGESLNYPRDPNGSPSNIINCRCVSHNQVQVEPAV